MSGQPSNTKSDQVAFRKEYMKTLNQQIANDDKNYDANQIYKKTGAPQQPTDTRSTTEKLRDIQSMKPMIRSKLLALMDGGEAEKVVGKLGDSEIQYLAQNVDNLVSVLKPRFKIGMYADIFLLELNKYAKSIEKASSVSTDGLITKEDLTNLINDISGKSGADAQRLAEQLQLMTELIPTEQDIQEITALQDKAAAAEAFVSIGRIIKLLPSKADLLKEQNIFDRRLAMGDEVGANRQIAKLVRLTENAVDMKMEADYLKSLLVRGDAVEAVNEEGGYVFLQEVAGMVKKQLLAYARKIKAGDPTIFSESLTTISKMNKSQLVALINSYDDEIRGYFGVEPTDEPSSYEGEIQYSPLRPTSMSSKSSSASSETGVSQASRQYGVGSLGAPSVVSSSEPTAGSGVRKKVKMGRGVGRPKTRNYEGSNRPKRSDILTKEDTDWNAGIKVQPRFLPFGRYIINKKQLDNNIVSIKTPSGSNVPSYKSHRVSSGMGIVLRKMVGGGNPTFDEVSALDEEERNYLSRIATASNIEDKFNIPTPNKNEDEKDVNQFEIMRGQIMAGNDSTELVKKFKLLIMKLSKKGLLPQREAKDLLYELVHLGY